MKQTKPGALFLITCLLFQACQSHDSTSLPSGAAGLTVQELEVPASLGIAPNLTATATGGLLLSWIAFSEDSLRSLMYSRLEADAWSDPVAVASGTPASWFVNWADFPALSTFPSGHLAAFWLQKHNKGTFNYDIQVSVSGRNGSDWSAPFLLHDDGLPAEHGFVSLLPDGDNRMLAVWLDGRNTGGGDGHDHEGHSGAMSLRTAVFDTLGNISEARELDARICDCCQTAAAMTSQGPIFAYRNRSDDEIRDIYYIRRVNGQWSDPKPVHHDGWMINGCPVNGPALAAHGSTVALAWFTAASGEGAVFLSWSEDAGETFGPPLRISEGTAIGRVDVVMPDAGQAQVSWMEQTGEGAEILLKTVSLDGSAAPAQRIAVVANSRKSGFPRMALHQNNLWMAWTAVKGDTTQVKTALLTQQ